MNPTSVSNYESIEPAPSATPNQDVHFGFIALVTFISAIGGFLFGYDTSVIGGANLYIQDDFPEITNFTKGMIVSVTMIGAAIGSLIGGVISDKYG